jgi:nitronate monooxygenase
MWHKNRLTEMLNLRYPIVQGPFGGGHSSPELVAAVTNAGGLGSFGAMNLAPEALGALCTSIRARTKGAFAVNLWVSTEDDDARDVAVVARYQEALEPLTPLFKELGIAPPALKIPTPHDFTAQAEALIEAAPPVFSFVFGVPSADILERCRQRGIVTAGTATTVEEAVALDEAGVDVIVATGFEAGGHRVSFLRSAESSLMGTLSLVPQVVDSVRTPVVAAGGIADGRGVAAVLALGASGAQIGTAFLACEESNATAHHRETLHSERAWHTVLTRAYSGRLGRGLANCVSDAYEKCEERPLPYPLQGQLSRALREAGEARDRMEFTPLWAGQSARLVRDQHAVSLMERIVWEVEERISSLRSE